MVTFTDYNVTSVTNVTPVTNFPENFERTEMLTYDPAVNVPANLDLRRDATILLVEDISLHILDLALEDAPTEEDIRLLTDFFDEEEWTGIFETETNGERIYQVTYKYDTAHFFITTYTMTYCKKVVPPHLYEES